MEGINNNIIDEILEKEELSYEDRVRYKLIGRPTPHLPQLKETGQSRKRDYIRSFNVSSYETWPWLAGSKDSLFCFPCLLFKVRGHSSSSWTSGFKCISRMKEKCDKHNMSKNHIANCVSLQFIGTRSIQRAISTAFDRSIIDHNIKVDKNRAIVRHILECIVFCGQYELPLRGDDESASSENRGVFNGLIHFMARSNAMVANHLNQGGGRGSATYTSNTSQNELLECCYIVYQEEILKQIRDTQFIAIMADETTDTSQTTQLVIVFRYLYNNQIREMFWGFFNPASTDAIGISKVLLTELAKVIPNDSSKLIGQTFDGASVMRGDKKGVKIKLQEVYKNAHYVHCYAHQLNLILKSSSKSKRVSRFFAQITAISNYFSRSPNRIKILGEFMSTRIASSSATRWNFGSRVVGTVTENYDAILDCLKKIEESLTESSIIDAPTLIHYMQSNSFLFYLELFNSILIHVSILFNQLQSRQTDISKVKSFIKQFKNQLEIIKENFVESNKPQAQVNEAIEVIANIYEDIDSRLEFKGHLMAETLFDNSRFADFNIIFPADTFKNALDAYSFLNRNCLQTELEIFYSREEFRNLSNLSDILNCLTTTNLISFFPETYKLLMLLLTIPMTTVDPERKFSTLKRIKTEIRNRMGDGRLNALTAISGCKPFFDGIEIQDKIIDKFANMKDRKMDLIKKM